MSRVRGLEHHLDVVVACEDDNDKDVEIPFVSVYYAWLEL